MILKTALLKIGTILKTEFKKAKTISMPILKLTKESITTSRCSQKIKGVQQCIPFFWFNFLKVQ